MMKRLLALTICLVVAVSLIGCTKAPGVKFSRGTWEGDVFTSEFLELTLTKPESWVITSDEEIEQMLGVGMELINIDEKETEAAKQQLLVDMMVADPATNTNISFLCHDLSMIPGGAKITEEEFAKQLVEQVVAMGGMGVEADEIKKITIGGNEYTYMSSVLSMNGSEMPQIAILRKVGDYMFNATAATPGGETVDEIFAMFS